jgi:hypothetical protein
MVTGETGVAPSVSHSLTVAVNVPGASWPAVASPASIHRVVYIPHSANIASAFAGSSWTR